jgi:hypothetical protein
MAGMGFQNFTSQEALNAMLGQSTPVRITGTADNTAGYFAIMAMNGTAVFSELKIGSTTGVALASSGDRLLEGTTFVGDIFSFKLTSGVVYAWLR